MRLFSINPDPIRSSITSINPRTEKHGGDDRVAAVDITVHALDLPAGLCAILFGLDDHAALEAFLFDDAGRVIARQVDWLPVGAKFENGYELSVNGRVEKVDRACKFKLKPTGGATFEVKVQLQISQPSDGLVEDALDAMTVDSISIGLTPLPDLLETLQREAAGIADEPDQGRIPMSPPAPTAEQPASVQ